VLWGLLMDNAPTQKRGRAVGAIAATAATAALACGVCCVLPIAIPAITLTGTGAVLAWWGNAHAWATGLATLAVVTGWLWIWRQSAKSKARPARVTLWLMGFASFALVAALAWPGIEPLMIRAISR
jgi:hypothetical protein